MPVAADLVVVDAAHGEFSTQNIDVDNEAEVGELSFEMSKERLDPGLVTGSAVVGLAVWELLTLGERRAQAYR